MFKMIINTLKKYNDEIYINNIKIMIISRNNAKITIINNVPIM